MNKKILMVSWQDHHSDNGWHKEDNINYNVFVNISVGFLVKETKNHIVLAQTDCQNSDLFGDLLFILKKTILKKKEVK